MCPEDGHLLHIHTQSPPDFTWNLSVYKGDSIGAEMDRDKQKLE